MCVILTNAQKCLGRQFCLKITQLSFFSFSKKKTGLKSSFNRFLFFSFQLKADNLECIKEVEFNKSFQLDSWMPSRKCFTGVNRKASRMKWCVTHLLLCSPHFISLRYHLDNYKCPKTFCQNCSIYQQSKIPNAQQI